MAKMDWAFDIRAFVESNYAAEIGFVPDEEQTFSDRIVGQIDGNRAVIVPRPVGWEYAERFYRWVTVSRSGFDGMTGRPTGWRFFILMVGLLPDGQPWWGRLYDEQVLAQRKEHSEFVNPPGFYRFDPGLTDQAFVLEWHKDKPRAQSPAEYVVTFPDHAVPLETRDQAEAIGSIWDWAEANGRQAEGKVDVLGDRMLIHLT